MKEEYSFSAQELLAQIGLKLRAAREAKGITIQEVAAQTRINLVFLTKIEAGDTTDLPGLAFVRGFIRNYLQVLELEDPDLEADLQSIGALKQFVTESALGSRIAEMHGEDTPSRLKIPVIIGVAVVLVLWGGYMDFRILSGPGKPEPQTTRVEKAKTSGAEKAQSGNLQGEKQGQPPENTPKGKSGMANLTENPPKASPREESDRPSQPENQNQPTPRDKTRVDKTATAKTSIAKPLTMETQKILKLTVRGLEPTWVRLSIDRAPPLEVKVEPAETMDWEANEEIRLTIGKSQGVAVYLNGEDILVSEKPDQLVPSIVLNKLTLLRLEN